MLCSSLACILASCRTSPSTSQEDLIQIAVARSIETYAAEGIPVTGGEALYLRPTTPKGPVDDPDPGNISENLSIPPTGSPFPITLTPPTKCNQVLFLEDVTIPDGTVVSPGQNLVKKWRIQNAGSCAWARDYQVVYYGAREKYSSPLTGDEDNEIGEKVSPGAMTVVSMNLFAPVEEGEYEFMFMLKDTDGSLFGVGEKDYPFWLSITVSKEANATKTPSPTKTASPTKTPSPTPTETCTPKPKIHISGAIKDIQPGYTSVNFPINIDFDATIQGLQSGETLSIPFTFYLSDLPMICNTPLVINFSENGRINTIIECTIPNEAIPGENYVTVSISEGYYSWDGVDSFLYMVGE